MRIDLTVRELINYLSENVIVAAEWLVEWAIQAIVLFLDFTWLDLGIFQAVALLAVIAWYIISRTLKDEAYVEDVLEIMRNASEEEKSLYAKDIEYLRRVEKSGIKFYFYKGLKLLGLCILAWFIGYALTENNADRGVQWVMITALYYWFRCNDFRDYVRRRLERFDYIREHID